MVWWFGSVCITCKHTQFSFVDAFILFASISSKEIQRLSRDSIQKRCCSYNWNNTLVLVIACKQKMNHSILEDKKSAGWWSSSRYRSKQQLRSMTISSSRDLWAISLVSQYNGVCEIEKWAKFWWLTNWLIHCQLLNCYRPFIRALSIQPNKISISSDNSL